MDSELLKDYGVDYDKGLKNCIGNEKFYKKILSMFLEDHCFLRAEDAFENWDQKELFSRMHELKGISGNAALVGLYDATLPLVELLRTGDVGREDSRVMFEAARAAYARACEGIALIMSED